MEHENHKFLFSVIIPIYNVEKYLREAVDSVINQTIGFKENIQLILINDGSKDNSGRLCEEYRDKYPENVIYIYQENAGVSTARNKGLSYAEGEYVNFLDSDDKWDINVFEKVYKFFKSEYEHIDVVACRIRFFEKKNGFSHALDFKFDQDKIVNIFDEYDHVQLSCASTFIKGSVIKKYRFNSAVKYSEDALLMCEIILEQERYGVLRDAVYNYRKRENETSAIDRASADKALYINTVEFVMKALFNISKEKYGEVIRYIQYQIMYDLQWYIGKELPSSLNQEEKDAYVHNVKQLLKDTEDVVICSQRNMDTESKVYALKLKYGRDITKEFVFDKSICRFNNGGLFNLKTNALIKVIIMKYENGCLFLEGKISGLLHKDDYDVYLLTDRRKRIDLEYYNISYIEDYIMDKSLVSVGFKAIIPLSDTLSFKAFVTYKGKHTSEANIYFGKFAAINNEFSYSYYCVDDYIIKKKYNKILIYKNTLKKHFKIELRYMQQLLQKRQLDVVICRILYYSLKSFYKRPIWIVSDRTNKANDNGIHFFNYLNNKKNRKYNYYFAIDKNADGYKNIKKLGKVLRIGSYRYLLLFLLSDKIISSQGDDWVINAFRRKEQYLKDLYKFDFIFLQHGVIKDDLSKWLHKLNKNIRIFVTSAEDEWDSIAHGNYGYTEDEVKLTGLPRFDKLENQSMNKIVFMPTWRTSIASKTKPGSSEREYNENFKNSEYFLFYNKLINDERILNAFKEKGFTARFCIHPSFEKQATDFTENEFVKIDVSEVDYQKEFRENKLLITDFSSVAFDFAYLNKPVIYTQYDADTFFKGQIYDRGYFSYEDDGFGPVAYDYESSVEEIVKQIENGCEIEEKYKDRINEFYEFHDKNNCKRVYEEIIKLGKAGS